MQENRGKRSWTVYYEISLCGKDKENHDSVRIISPSQWPSGLRHEPSSPA
jgi:hypothetical protein